MKRIRPSSITSFIAANRAAEHRLADSVRDIVEAVRKDGDYSGVRSEFLGYLARGPDVGAG